jgi:hypothetical protein
MKQCNTHVPETGKVIAATSLSSRLNGATSNITPKPATVASLVQEIEDLKGRIAIMVERLEPLEGSPSSRDQLD